jgi:hypothetical protein
MNKLELKVLLNIRDFRGSFSDQWAKKTVEKLIRYGFCRITRPGYVEMTIDGIDQLDGLHEKDAGEIYLKGGGDEKAD